MADSLNATTQSLRMNESTDFTTMSGELVSCPLCHDDLIDPKCLPCLHTFCKTCLIAHITDKVAIDEKTSEIIEFRCPVCRVQTKPPTATPDPNVWADAFPSNHFVSGLMDMLSFVRDKKPCDPCLRRKEIKTSVYWCKDCNEFLCETCGKVHIAMKVSLGHILVDADSLREDPNNFMVGTHPCPEHSEKIKMFCGDHRVACCGVCVAVHHRKCDNVMSVGDYLSEMKTTNGIEELYEKLHDFQNSVTEVATERTKLTENLIQQKQHVINKINTVRVEINSLLKRLEEKITEDFDDVHRQEVGEIRNQVKRCESLNQGIANATKMLRVAESHGSDVQLVTTVTKIGDEFQNYEDCLEQIHKDIHNLDYEFECDGQLRHILQALKQIGTLKVYHSSSKLPPYVSEVKQYDARKAKEFGKFKARLAGEHKTCWLTGGIYLSDGRIILCDRDNKKVKMFDESGNLIHDLQLSFGPWDVTMVNDRKIAVTVPDTKKIQIITLTDKTMVLEGTIAVGGECRGVSYIDGKYAVTCFPPSLKIISANGVESLSIIMNEGGQRVFSRPRYVAATRSTRELLVTDWDKNTVYAHTSEGEPVFSYTFKDLKRPTGIATDYQGNIYVCGRNSSNIHQLNAEGDRLRILLSAAENNVKFPRKIAFEPRGEKFFITCDHSPSRDMVTIFSFV